MSNFSNDHHEQTRAALFQAWYDIQSPRVQERITRWVFFLSDYHMVGTTLPKTALAMAESTLWAVYEKNPRDFLALLERQALEQVKG